MVDVDNGWFMALPIKSMKLKFLNMNILSSIILINYYVANAIKKSSFRMQNAFIWPENRGICSSRIECFVKFFVKVKWVQGVRFFAC